MTLHEHIDAVFAVANECVTGGEFRMHINGNCMSPAIKHGDEATVRRSTFYFPGDVIVFRTNRSFVAHRVLGWIPSRRGIGLLTKGDHCERHDGVIDRSRVLGRLDAHVAPADRLRALFAFMAVTLRRLLRRT